MHLRKLAWAVPLMLAATAVHAENAGSFLEGAKLASLARPEAAAPAHGPSVHAGGAHGANGTAPRSPAATPSMTEVLTADAADTESRSSFEIRNFLTLVVALALVGWIQRRRRDA
ncbi:MAG: hypothetical protein J7598_14470 [Mitsuaria chitosanitabida]|jgi:hypothetical protein|nr:hypothetical protein [Roseateles chitosanitabidus]MBO9687806.1 hypothetical protein [Roseateles chitosanitabidus]